MQVARCHPAPATPEVRSAARGLERNSALGPRSQTQPPMLESLDSTVPPSARRASHASAAQAAIAVAMDERAGVDPSARARATAQSPTDAPDAVARTAPGANSTAPGANSAAPGANGSAQRTTRLARLAQRGLREGVAALSTAELLRLIAGSRGAGPADPCERLLALSDLAELSRGSPAEWLGARGLRRIAAARLAASFELGRRAARAGQPARPLASSPERVQRLLAPELAGLEREQFVVLLLDGKHRLRRIERVSEGTLTSSLVHPREVFRAAVRESAAALIAAHNHPSGDPEPSAEDYEVTRRLREAGALLGIPLLDHVVLGSSACVSLRARMGF